MLLFNCLESYLILTHLTLTLFLTDCFFVFCFFLIFATISAFRICFFLVTSGPPYCLYVITVSASISSTKKVWSHLTHFEEKKNIHASASEWNDLNLLKSNLVYLQFSTMLLRTVETVKLYLVLVDTGWETLCEYRLDRERASPACDSEGWTDQTWSCSDAAGRPASGSNLGEQHHFISRW